MTLTDREQRILSYIRNQVSQGRHPGNEQIARSHGLAMHHVTNALNNIKAAGFLSSTGYGPHRRFHVEAIEPVRVDRVICPRCGAVNCTRHSVAFLTSASRLPAYAGV